MKTLQTKYSAFTLIELLAVVAIILLLLSLLVPALSGARDRADFAVCKSNLRQIGAAADLHATDHGGEWPDAWQWINCTGQKTGSFWIEWTIPGKIESGTLFPYMGGNLSAYLCNTFKKVAPLNTQLPAGSTAYFGYDMVEYYRTNYHGAKVDGIIQGWSGHDAIHRAYVLKPAKEGIFCEEDPWPSAYDTGFINNACFGTDADALASFHLPPNGDILQGFSNVWFADGHVEKAHPAQSHELMTPECVKLNYH
jgi:prepilin-type processing-associated H-X9-DG protein